MAAGSIQFPEPPSGDRYNWHRESENGRRMFCSRRMHMHARSRLLWFRNPPVSQTSKSASAPAPPLHRDLVLSVTALAGTIPLTSVCPGFSYTLTVSDDSYLPCTASQYCWSARRRRLPPLVRAASRRHAHHSQLPAFRLLHHIHIIYHCHALPECLALYYSLIYLEPRSLPPH